MTDIVKQTAAVATTQQAAAEPVRFTDTTGTLERARACTEVGHLFSVDAASGIRFCDNCGLGEVAARKVDRLQPAPASAQPQLSEAEIDACMPKSTRGFMGLTGAPLLPVWTRDQVHATVRAALQFNKCKWPECGCRCDLGPEWKACEPDTTKND